MFESDVHQARGGDYMQKNEANTFNHPKYDAQMLMNIFCRPLNVTMYVIGSIS